jgi:hypothetical protein
MSETQYRTVDAQFTEAMPPASSPKTIHPSKGSAAILFGRLALVGAGALCAVSLVANIAPYSAFWGSALAKFTPLDGRWLTGFGYAVGVTSFLMIQSLEILPLLMRDQYSVLTKNLQALSGFFYLVDLGFGLYFFPPLKTDLIRYLLAGNLLDVRWMNILIIVITLYSWELFVNLYRLLSQIKYEN